MCMKVCGLQVSEHNRDIMLMKIDYTPHQDVHLSDKQHVQIQSVRQLMLYVLLTGFYQGRIQTFRFLRGHEVERKGRKCED